MGVISTALRRPGTYLGHAAEAVFTAQCALLYPFGVTQALLTTGSSRGAPEHDTPVLLVHGYGHNRSGWYLLDRSLRRAGFTSVHTMNYWPLRGVPELAAGLAARVRDVLELTGAERVHVVGHSTGGVLLRWYIQELGGDEVVDTAITVASPHEGTLSAYGGMGTLARDLRPGSTVMRRLAVRARPTPVRWVAYYSNLDVVVQPAASAMLRHPVLEATNILVKDHGHVSMMLSGKVSRSIVDQLQAAAGHAAEITPLSKRRDQETVNRSTSRRTASGDNAFSTSVPG